MPREKVKEHIKTAVLVVLFLITVLLLYIFWSDQDLNEIRLPDLGLGEEEEVISAKKVTMPEQIIVDFNNDVYAAAAPEENGIWDQILSSINEFALDPKVVIESVSEEKFQEVKEFGTVRFCFDYRISLPDFCRICGIAEADGFSSVEGFNAILVSEGSPDSIFFLDSNAKACYRIGSKEVSSPAGEMIANIEVSGYDPYYRLGTLAGTEDTNVIPLSLYTSMEPVPCRRENVGDDQEFAQRFFGGSLDFIRVVTESDGTCVYMYGYGKTVLTVNTDGSAEYKAESSGSSGIQTYPQALDTVLEFITSRGGWLSEKNDGRLPYIKDVAQVEYGKMKGYQFVFGFRQGKAEMYCETGDCLVVEVVNGEITYYKRNMTEAGSLAVDENVGGRETFSAINVLAQNYPVAVSILEQEGFALKMSEGDQETLFNDYIALIDSMEAGYLRRETENGSNWELYPVWVVTVGKLTFYYDLFSADYLGYGSHYL